MLRYPNLLQKPFKLKYREPQFTETSPIFSQTEPQVLTQTAQTLQLPTNRVMHDENQ